MTLPSLPVAIAAALDARSQAPVMAFVRRRGDDTVLTGSQIDAGVAERAALLRDWLGVGRRVVLAMPKDVEFTLLLLACLRVGIPAVPVAVPRRGSKLDRFAHVLRNSGAAAVLCAPESRQAIEEAMRDVPDCPCVCVPLVPGALPPPGGADARGTEAVVQYTSGSTQAPKGVRITGANILANAALVGREWTMDSRARLINWLPHYHDMGLMGGILYPLLCGGMSVQIPSADFIRSPALWLETISRYKGNFSGGPAFGFAEVIRRVAPPALQGLDLSGWSRAYCGAEPVPADLGPRFHAHLAETGLPSEAFFACYGLAEMTLFAAGVPGTGRIDSARSCGTAGSTTLPCGMSEALRDTIRIAAPGSIKALPDGEDGEILLRGPSQGAGYLSLPKETAETFNTGLEENTGEEGGAPRGWLRTGDLGRIDAAGLHISGRIKDIVICHGLTIAAPEIERVACLAHGGLDPMAAAAFAPDPLVSGKAVVVAERKGRGTGPDSDTAAFAAAARAVIGEWGLELAELLVVPRGRLPRTTSGKIRRAAVAAAWRNGNLDGQPATEPAAAPVQAAR
ncbi:AMP-binding protein [Meridianimarinicoccus roseus]|nr:AMP-binding protein [Meridianimarinicoccus roseus]